MRDGPDYVKSGVVEEDEAHATGIVVHDYVAWIAFAHISHNKDVMIGETNGKIPRPKRNRHRPKLAISNMMEIAVLRELLFEKGIIGKEEFLAEFKQLDREMKER
jgi:hypothetical protein